MKKLIVCAGAALLAATAPQAFAQTKNFEGFSGGLNVNFANLKTDLAVGPVSLSGSDSSQNASIQGQYGLAIAKNAVIGLGLTYGIGELKSGTIKAGTTTITSKSKEIYSLNIEPGFVVSPTTLIYGKLAFQTAKGESSDGTTSSTKTFNGTSYGLGFRTFMSKNIYFQGEFVQLGLNSQTDSGVEIKPSGQLFSIGVGMKF